MAEDKNVSELMKEFVATLMTYLKQRGVEFVTAVTVEPLKKFAGKAALGCAGLTLVLLGLIFLGLFMVQGFASLFGGSYLWGYLASAVLVMLIGAILMLVMARGGKEEVASKDDKPKDGADSH